jgi:hypothetical protein
MGSVFTSWRLPDGQPTFMNHLTRPGRPSITKILKLIEISLFTSWRLPGGCEPHHPTRYILNSNNISFQRDTFIKSYLWCNYDSARAREVEKQNRPGGDRTSDIEPTRQDMASIFNWWQWPDDCEPQSSRIRTGAPGSILELNQRPLVGLFSARRSASSVFHNLRRFDSIWID